MLQTDEATDVTRSTAPMATCLQPADLTQHVSDYYEDQIFSVAPGEGLSPVSSLQTEASAFPTLFPDGKNTFEQLPSLSYSQYIKARLLSCKNDFTSNSEYIFHVQYCKELQEIISSAQISVRKGSSHNADNKPITASTLGNVKNVQELIGKGEGYKLLARVRGSAPYWEATTKDLFVW